LLTATALLAALLTTLTSGLLLLLTGLLLATLLATLLTTLLLPALLHITHFVVRHRALSFAEGLRGTTIFLRPFWFPDRRSRWAAMPEQGPTAVVSPNYSQTGVVTHAAPPKCASENGQTSSSF
jgi:hypothetical protein